jgi:hypothetical protein
MLNKALLHCARDIEQMYFAGVPLHKAIRHMQYLINYQEIRQAKIDLKNRYNRITKPRRRYLKGV